MNTWCNLHFTSAQCNAARLLELPGAVRVLPKVWVTVPALIPQRGIYLDVHLPLPLAIIRHQSLCQTTAFIQRVVVRQPLKSDSNDLWILQQCGPSTNSCLIVCGSRLHQQSDGKTARASLAVRGFGWISC